MSDRGPLGEHPLGDSPRGIAIERLEASLRQRLFGDERTAKLARFTVLEPLGRGGMGTVYAAYDPKLDRKVAIKVVRPDQADEGSASRLLAEAKTLARLSHPNVVTIYEVGEVEHDVFIAMEYLGGGTLADWIERHPGEPSRWAAVVAMFDDVGRGLSAAHAEGIVHRDFKPANVLLGTDGRPRVVDFGLARVAEPTASATVGTPAYMAPEQRSGAAVDARADQYSFCVALHEALLGERPAIRVDGTAAPSEGMSTLPRPLATALRRGLSPAPEDRFPTLDALLDAIRPRRGRARTVVGVGVVVAAIVGAAALGSHSTAARADPCAEPRAATRDAWPDGAELEPRLDAAGSSYRDEVLTQLDAQCGETPDLAAVACLRRSGLQLAAVAHAVGSASASPTTALETIKRLPDPTECTNPARLASEPSLPTDPERRERRQAQRDRLAAAMVDAMLGHESQAKAVIEASLASDDLVVRAEAEYVAGSLEARAVRGAAAHEHLRAAGLAAEAAGFDWLKVIATIDGAVVVAQLLGRPDDATRQLEAARAGITRLGNPATLHDSLRATEGLVAFAAGRPDDAIVALTEAIEAIELRAGTTAFALVQPCNVLAASHAAKGQFDQAYATFDRVRALVQTHYGTTHPLYGRVAINLGAAARDAGQLDRAAEHLEDAVALLAEHLGPSHPSYVQALHNLADVEGQRGRVARALTLATDAAAAAERAHGADSPQLRWTLATLAAAQSSTGDHEAARRSLSRARALVVEAWGQDAVQLLELMEVEADILQRTGDHDARRRLLERADAIARHNDAQLPVELRRARSEP